MKKVLLLFILILFLINPAYAEEGDGSDNWMNSTITGLLNFLSGCIEVPEFTSIKNTLKDINLTEPGKWVATKTYVQGGKLLKIQWDLKNVESVPEKYLVLYRIDPRFRMPQVFIQRYDYAQERYISDFHQAYGGQFLKYQITPEMDFATRTFSYWKYFNYIDRSRIPVKKGDVVNITLDGIGKYFAANSDMQVELTREPSNPAIIYTESAGMDNAIIYTDIPAWCKVIEPKSKDALCEPPKGCKVPTECDTEEGKLKLINSVCNPPSGSIPTECSTVEGKENILKIKCNPDQCSVPAWCSTVDKNCTGTTYKSTIDLWGGLVGAPINGPFEAAKLSIKPCRDGSDGRGNTPICKYDKGRGMQLKVGSKIIKPTSESFVSSPYTNKDFFYYKSDADGDLNFTTSWQISGMFGGSVNQFMDFWLLYLDYNTFSSYLATYSAGVTMNFMHFGRYAMEVEVGNSEAGISTADLNNVKLEYIIMEDGAPSDSATGTEVSMDYKTNANTSGYLWLRVVNDSSGVGGSIKVKMANYTGSTWFSDIIYGKLIQPLRAMFNDITKQIYTKFITNPALQNIARGMMTLYILFYGLSYLAGATQLTVTDLVIRVLKIGVILALFSPTSWNFFNDNVFRIFIEGSDYLLSNIVGITSQVGNIFGFIDPIFDKYTNGTVWGLLFIQLLMIHNGLCFFAIMTIYSILLYFRAVLEVIISYCLAFLGLAIMVSLAPFFITFLLFEQTKSMFTNWISTMFQYMMQPTILLIFFLLIDQMMSEHILNTVVRACWGILIPIEIGLDLHFMGIPLSFSFTLPFLPGIPFYVSQVNEVNSLGDLVNGHGTFIVLATSALLFYAYCKMSYGLVDYVTIVIQNLTNVVPARQDGKLQDQSKSNPIHDIKSDMGKAISPVTSRVKGIGSFAKEKVIDQKITHREKPNEHGGVNTGGSNTESSGGSASSGKAGASHSWVSAKPTGTTARPFDATTGQSSATPKTNSKGQVPPKSPGFAERAAQARAESGQATGQSSATPKTNSKGQVPPKSPGFAERAAQAMAERQKAADLSANSGTKAPDQVTGGPQSGGSDKAARSDGTVKSFLAATRATVSDAPLTTAADQKKADNVGPESQRNEAGLKGQSLETKVEKDQAGGTQGKQPDDKKQGAEEQRKNQVDAKIEKENKKGSEGGGASLQHGSDDKKQGLDGKRNDAGETTRTTETKADKQPGGDQGAPQGSKQQNIDVNKEPGKDGSGLKAQGNQEANIDYNKGNASGGGNQPAEKRDSTLKPNNPSGSDAPEKVTTRSNTTNKRNLDDK